ncbi:hypothetical protein DFJ74DRAFT_701259 [Hyaloraphidium curvatum]|nr:hypothetical protein DFJ74DRAFT_701259 [Hyaloraphidium curvatum]
MVVEVARGPRRRALLCVISSATVALRLSWAPQAPAGPPVWMCLLVRDANADAAEWLDYHRSIGVSRFLVFDDGSRPPFPHAAPDVDVRPVPPRGPRGDVAFADSVQHRAYAECAARCPAGGWMGLLDVDEFVVLRTERPWLPRFLDGFRNAPAVLLNWVVLVGREYETRPAQGTLASYSTCVPRSFGTTRSGAKTLAQCRDLLGMRTAHKAKLAAGSFEVNERARRPGTCAACPSQWLDNPSHDGPAALFHYMYKSREEALAMVNTPDP